MLSICIVTHCSTDRTTAGCLNRRCTLSILLLLTAVPTELLPVAYTHDIWSICSVTRCSTDRTTAGCLYTRGILSCIVTHCSADRTNADCLHTRCMLSICSVTHCSTDRTTAGCLHTRCMLSICTVTHFSGTRGGAVGWGTALQARRSRVRFPTVSLEFFIDIILPVALWPWSWLSL